MLHYFEIFLKLVRNTSLIFRRKWNTWPVGKWGQKQPLSGKSANRRQRRHIKLSPRPEHKVNLSRGDDLGQIRVHAHNGLRVKSVTTIPRGFPGKWKGPNYCKSRKFNASWHLLRVCPALTIHSVLTGLHA